MNLFLKDTELIKPKDIEKSSIVNNLEDEKDELVSDLVELLNSVNEKDNSIKNSFQDKSKILISILTEPLNRFGPKSIALKESSIYLLIRLYCTNSCCKDVLSLITGRTCSTFFDNVSKAKCAKIVRNVMDMIGNLAPLEYEIQIELCRHVIQWCHKSKRSFLRQRAELKLASTFFMQEFFTDSLEILNKLIPELKKLDDKQLLVEVYLLQAKVYYGLRSNTKARSSLTSCRTCANAVYVTPSLQGNIDLINGILHCEEGDYNTAHSYFLEAFDQLDPSDDCNGSLSCLKYMMLCRILDDLFKNLGKKNEKGLQERPKTVTPRIISLKQKLKYSCRDLDAMEAIAFASSQRSLKLFDDSIKSFKEIIQDDLLIRHNLIILREKLIESNLIRIIEPYSCVEISHLALLIEMPDQSVEKKLSQMILDGTLNGILDQGQGHLNVFDERPIDTIQEKGLKLISNVDNIVSSLFVRSKHLSTMMN